MFSKIKVIHLHTNYFEPTLLKYGAVESLILTLHSSRSNSSCDHEFFNSRDFFAHLKHVFFNSYDVVILHDLSLLSIVPFLKVKKVFCYVHSGVIARYNDIKFPSLEIESFVKKSINQALYYKNVFDVNYIVLNTESYLFYRSFNSLNRVFIGRNSIDIDRYRKKTVVIEFKGLVVGNDNPIKRFEKAKSNKYKIDFFGKSHNPEISELSRTEMLSIFSEYDFLIHLSYSEGQSLVLIEALACGLHIIISSNLYSNFKLFTGLITIIPEEIIQESLLLPTYLDNIIEKIKNEDPSLADRRINLAKKLYSTEISLKRIDAIIQRGVPKQSIIKWKMIFQILKIYLRSVLKKEKILFLN